MEKKPKQESLLEKAAELFDLPGNVVAGLSRIEITGRRALLLENHKGILAYSTEEIHVSVHNAVVKIKGEGLLLRAMNAEALLIAGTLSSIEFVV